MSLECVWEAYFSVNSTWYYYFAMFLPILQCGAASCLFCNSDKSGYSFLKMTHHILVGAHQAELFLNKYSL